MHRLGCRGFTLLELVIALVILAILLAGAVPAFQGLIERQRLTGAGHQFLAALAHTRQAAIAHSHDVTLCPSRDSRSCLPRGRWHQGWIAFVDRDEDREHDLAEPVVLSNHGLDAVTLTSSRWRRRITFQPVGTAGGSNATFTLCHGERRRAVILSRLGRARIARQGPGGRALECPGKP